MEYTTLVKELLKIIKATDIEEIKISDGDFSVSLLKENNKSSPTVTVSNGATPSSRIEKSTPSDTGSSRPTEAKKRVAIKSPMVGRFFNSAGPDKPPYVMKGNHVEYGQKVGVVEAMKIYKDVVSSVKGVIVEVLIENNTTVEYGQEIYLVETE